MGKHSGRYAFREKIKALGYELGDNQMQEAFVRFEGFGRPQKHVFDDDIVALVDDEVAKGTDRIKLVSLRVVAGSADLNKPY